MQPIPTKAADAETCLVAAVASWLSLTSGTSIWRGKIPDGADNGVAVIVGDDLSGNEPGVPKLSAQVLIKRTTRDAAVALGDTLRANLPAFGVTGGSKRISQILKRGGGGVYAQTDNGAIRYYSSTNLVLTMPPG